MSLYNMPDGCYYPSDIDFYNALNPEQQCEGCKQAVSDCECVELSECCGAPIDDYRFCPKCKEAV